MLAGIYNVGILTLWQPFETTFFQCYSDISKTQYLQANDTLWLCDNAIRWRLNKGTLVWKFLQDAFPAAPGSYFMVWGGPVFFGIKRPQRHVGEMSALHAI